MIKDENAVQNIDMGSWCLDPESFPLHQPQIQGEGNELKLDDKKPSSPVDKLSDVLDTSSHYVRGTLLVGSGDKGVGSGKMNQVFIKYETLV